MKTASEILVDSGYEDVIIFSEPSYDTALIGVTIDNEAVYDYEKMVEYLVQQDGMSYEEATDFISYNSSYRQGDGYPIIMYPLQEDY